MQTKLAFETMIKILPDVAEIYDDDAVQEFKRIVKRKDQNNTSAMLNVIIPMFATNKRDTLLRILSAITGKTVEQLNDQPFTQTVKDMSDGFIGDMMTFFLLCVRMVARA